MLAEDKRLLRKTLGDVVKVLMPIAIVVGGVELLMSFAPRWPQYEPIEPISIVYNATPPIYPPDRFLEMTPSERVYLPDYPIDSVLERARGE